jgi:hypothetical protein
VHEPPHLQVGEGVLEKGDGALSEAVGVEGLLAGGGLEVLGGLGRGWGEVCVTGGVRVPSFGICSTQRYDIMTINKKLT